jgi:hypothetical protein
MATVKASVYRSKRIGNYWLCCKTSLTINESSVRIFLLMAQVITRMQDQIETLFAHAQVIGNMERIA